MNGVIVTEKDSKITEEIFSIDLYLTGEIKFYYNLYQ